jgi:hypothetical protein
MPDPGQASYSMKKDMWQAVWDFAQCISIYKATNTGIGKDTCS